MPEAAHGFGLERARGALVREVVDGGPAAKAGLEPGDVILSFEGKLIEDANDLPLLAGDAGAGKKVALEVLRDKAKKTVGVVLGEHPDNTPAPEKTLDKTPEKAPPKDLSVGVTVVTLDNAARERLSLKGTSGTRIVKVKMGSAAFMGGLMTDDVVIKVNGKATADAKEFAAALKATPSGELLKMIVRRAGSTLFVAVVKP
jgi:serine protease Do